MAQSTAPTAVAVRAAVGQLIAEGRTDQQIKDYLVDRYGSSIVLDPPASGWSLLVWLLPLLAGLVATSALAVVLVRRRRLPGGGDRGPASDLTAEQAGEHRLFLIRSLADADAEYLAGDLSDQDYLALRRARHGAVGGAGRRRRPAGGGPALGARAARRRRCVDRFRSGRRPHGRGGRGKGSGGSTSTARRWRNRARPDVPPPDPEERLVSRRRLPVPGCRPGRGRDHLRLQPPAGPVHHRHLRPVAGPADRGGPGPGGHRREPGPGGPGRPALPVGAR